MRFYLFALFVLASTLVYSLAKPISDPYPDEGDHSFGLFPAEFIRNKRGISIKGNNRGDIHAPCTAVVCNKKKREVHFESEDTNESDQKILVESPLLESPDSDSSRQKRGISIGGNNRGDIHAPCTAVVCNKKKREIQMNADKVETFETNAQIPQNQELDQNSNLGVENLKKSEINPDDSEISRGKRACVIMGGKTFCGSNNSDTDVFIPGDSNRRRKRSWACVGNCGDVRILGNRLIRSGGDDTCVCLEQ